MQRQCVVWARSWYGRVVMAAGLLGSTGCRIYRDEPSPDTSAEASSNAASASAAGQEREGTEAAAPAAPPAEALSLWVLNRPKAELMAPPKPPVEEVQPEVQAPALALVVLGLGASHACAEPWAGRVLRLAAAGEAPLEAIGSVLDEMRRWRWPGAEAARVDAVVRGSEGSRGAIQSAAVDRFSGALLGEAVRRAAVLDGRAPRWRTAESTAAPAPGAAPCELSPEGLRGPLGIALRTASGQFFAGLVEVAPPSDAGVLSYVTQPDLALAAGPSGAVLLISDCPSVPEAASAERMHDALLAGLNGPAPSTYSPGCSLAHALLGSERAEVRGETSVAWASSTLAAPAPEPEPSGPGAPAAPPARIGDAGAPPPGEPPP